MSISDDNMTITLSNDSMYSWNTGATGAIGASGQIYTITSNGTSAWGNSVNTTSISSPLVVNGDATIEGELILRGVSLSERLDKIDERLGILHCNEELESKWENLRGLRQAYMELEAEIKEKEKVWSILQK
jgi:hypothetical protein